MSAMFRGALFAICGIVIFSAALGLDGWRYILAVMAFVVALAVSGAAR